MKRNYIKPEQNVLLVQISTIMAGSGEPTATIDLEKSVDADAIQSRWTFSVWEDEE